MEDKLAYLSPVLQMLGNNVLQSIIVSAPISDAFGINNKKGPLILAYHHAMGSGALDAQARSGIDLFTQ